MAERTVMVRLGGDASGLVAAVNAASQALKSLGSFKLRVDDSDYQKSMRDAPVSAENASKSITSAMAGVAPAFAKSGDAAKAAATDQKEFDKAVTGVSRTLDSATGAVTANTRAWAANQIGPEKLRELDALGVSTRDYISAVIGVPAAQEKMRAALAGNSAELRTLDTNIAMVVAAQGNFAVKSDAVAASSLGVKADLQQLGAVARTAAGDLDTVGAGGVPGLRSVSEDVTKAKTAFGSLKESMAAQVSVGALAANGIMSAFFAVKQAITSTIDAGINFQTMMFTLQAVTGDQMNQVGTSFADVSAKARELGKDISLPGTSATDAASAMLELAKGGFSVADSMTAAKGTLQLAAAATISAADAAEIQVNAMNAFSLGADQASHVADVLANVANAASGDLTDFAYALTAGGATAHSFGISIEDTNTMLGLFAAAGIKGEEGGTLLKTMLVRLAAATGPAAGALKDLGVTAYDSNGNFEGLRKLTEQLAAAQKTMSMEAFNSATALAFGTRGIKGAAIAAKDGTEAYDWMNAAMMRNGTASDVAAAKMQGLGGAFENVKNQVQDVQLEAFAGFKDGLTSVVNTFASDIPALAAVAFGAITNIGSKVGDLLSPVIDGIQQLFASAATSDALKALGTDLGALGTAAVAVFGALEPLTSLLGNVIGWFSDLPAPIQAAAFALGAITLLHGPLSTVFSGIASGLIGLGGMFTGTAEVVVAAGGRMAFSMGIVRTAAEGMWTAMGGWIGVGVAAVVGLFALFTSGSNDATVAVTDLSDAVDANTGKLKANATQILATLLAQDGSLQAYNSIGGVVGDYTAALTGNVAAQGAVHTQLLDAATAAVESSHGWTTLTDAQKAAGLPARDIASSILAGGDAGWYQTDALNGVIAASQNFAAESGNLVAKQNEATLALQASGSAAVSAASSVASVQTSTQSLADTAAAGVDPITLMSSALTDGKTAADAFDAAGNFLIQTLTLIKGGVVDTETVTRANAATFRSMADAAGTLAEKQQALAELTGHVGETMNGQAVSASNLAVTQSDVDKATRAVQEADDGLWKSQVAVATSADELAGRAYTLASANGDLNAGVAAAVATMWEQRNSFIAAAEAAGSTADEANALADKIGLIPKDTQLKLEAQNLPALKAEVADLTSKLQGLDKQTFTYNLVGTQIIKYDLTPGTGASSVTDQIMKNLYGGAEGGFVSGPGGPTSDSVPALLSAGEFVVNTAQTTKYRGLLESINNSADGFAAGGVVGRFAAGGAVATTDATAGATPTTTAPLAPAPSMVPDSAAIAAAWTDIAATITAAWNTQILPTFDLLDARSGNIGVEFAALDTDHTVPAWTDIAATISTAWLGTIQPTYLEFNAGTVEVGNQWTWLNVSTGATAWSQISATIRSAWVGTIAPTYSEFNAGTVGVGATLQATWAGVISPTFDAINTGAAGVEWAWQNLANITADTWSQIGGSVDAAYQNQIVPAWNGVQGFANSTGAFFGGIAAGMNSASTTTTADLTSIQAAIDTFFQMVDAKAPVAAATAATGLADGGMITQGTGPRADDVTVRVSKGEYVVNAQATARHKSELDAINSGGYADGGIVGFADGGLIGDKIGNRVENAVVGGVERAFDAGVTRILASVAATISGYTPGSVEGTRGAFLDAVASKMGTAYVWGAAGPDVFDCSGLMSWALEQAGAGVGRLTAQQFNESFPHIPEAAVVPGDLVTFDTGRLPGQAGHIGAVMDTVKHLMMNTDGSGPAGIADYESRDGGPLSFIDPIGGGYVPHVAAGAGDPPSAGWLARILARIAAGGTGAPAAAGNIAYNGTAGVEQWRDTVLTALSLTQQSPTLADTILYQMQTESSGNPNAINLTDSNAAKGTPSEGLLQVIQPTFDSYALAPYNQNIWDPLSNIIAAIRYTIGAYGSVAAGMQGHAYAAGGIVPGRKSDKDTVPAWLSPGEAVISSMPGTAAANKSYLDTAASWFGGNVNYPGDAKSMPPVGYGAPTVNVAAPKIELYLYGDSSALDGRIDVKVDGALSDVAVKINRARVST